MFRRSAEIYDFLYGGTLGRVYADDAREIDGLIRRHSPHAASLLDVACGTGGHLEALKATFEAAGLDVAPEMVAIARSRNPDLDIRQADMRDFDFGRTFDAVTCLFSSIGYMTTIGDLNAAIANMARHTAPGGVLLVEAWIEPDAWQDGRIALGTVESDEVTVARMSHSSRIGRVSQLPMHHLVGTAEGIEHFVEHHEMGLFTQGEYEAAFAAAGMTVTRDGEALLGRGVYAGTRV